MHPQTSPTDDRDPTADGPTPRARRFGPGRVHLATAPLQLRAQGPPAQDALDDLPAACYRVKPDGTILYANHAFRALLGIPEDEPLASLNAVSLYADPAQPAEWMTELLAQGSLTGFEKTLVHRSGRMIWVHDNARVVEGAGGPVVEAVLVDISRQHTALRYLSEVKDRYQRLFDGSPLPMWEEDFSALASWLDTLRARGIVDLSSHLTQHPTELEFAVSLVRVVHANPGAVRYVGADTEAQLLVSLADSLSPEAHAAWIEQILAVWEGRHTLTISGQGQTLTGQPIEYVMYWVTASPQERPGFSRVVVSMVDVTARRGAERRLRELLSSKDDFITSVSHQIRTPLTSIVGFSEELAGRWDDTADSDRRESVDIIAQQAREAAAIAVDLITAAQLGGRKPDLDLMPLRLDDQVRQYLADLEATTRQGIRTNLAEAGAWADPARVRQIVRNLLSNALRYGGPTVEISTHPNGDGTSQLIVRDDGPGVPDADGHRLFDGYVAPDREPGQRTPLGLGLPMCRGLAAAMGGALTYRRRQDHTEFILELPCRPNGQGHD
jgi:PAS domain S-box-containing protein